MEEKKSKKGRPKGEANTRTQRVCGYVTEDDYQYVKQVAEALKMSNSELITAIVERLVIGGFSGLSFIKLGWQFAQVNSKLPDTGFYFGVRPFPPLIADADDPDVREFRRFLREMVEEFTEQKEGK